MLRDGRLFGRKTGCFTLQWHLTNRCDLRCRHCYDREPAAEIELADALRVVSGLVSFGRRRRVRSHVSLTGGNPLLHSRFFEIYEAVVRAGLRVRILGNPVAESDIARMARIRRPDSYQVSLEGREIHNDSIRGPGSYRRSLEFLSVLRRHRIPSVVMLTLTRANMDEVIPLGEALRGLVHRFTWNRLSKVGGGEDLESTTREDFESFVARYHDASMRNPVLAWKDNLLNIVRHREGLPLTGGCTGHGCGAAFDFLALHPDGEAHACRKFPSPVGNLLEIGLDAVYRGRAARRYRAGSRACRGCPIRNVCGGCLAVAHGEGRDALVEIDPHCFLGPPATGRRWRTAGD